MSNPYVGEIRMFGGTFAPVGWMFCQGQLVSIADYETLFELIGTTYGGDGQSTFALPNLASRFPVHQGTLTGGSAYALGQTGGSESVTVTVPQLPAHSHPVAASAGSATTTAPGGAVWANWGGGEYSNATPNATMSSGALASAGGSQPHDNMPPFLVINFIISLYGIFPTPS